MSPDHIDGQLLYYARCCGIVLAGLHNAVRHEARCPAMPIMRQIDVRADLEPTP